MSQVNNVQTLNFVNQGCKFISGMLLAHEEGLDFDVQLRASHQRFPTAWIDIPAKISYEARQVLIEFLRPGNHFNYRIELYGEAASAITASFVDYESKARPDVLENIKRKTITFAAPVRNCGSDLLAGLDLAARIGSYFKDYKIVVFENDSVDNTKIILSSLKENEKIKIIQKDGLDKSFPFRTERISFARNTLFNEVKKIGSDYFCTMDLDGVIGSNFDFDGFLSNFHFDECWDAVFPANTDKYYDIWTLRHPDICPGDYERQMNTMDPIFSDAIIFDACLTNLQSMDFRKLKGWLQVTSAFGGMGIYKTSKFVHSNYFGVKDGYEASDHVAFHKKAVESGALLYINPGFLVNSKLGL